MFYWEDYSKGVVIRWRGVLVTMIFKNHLHIFQHKPKLYHPRLPATTPWTQ